MTLANATIMQEEEDSGYAVVAQLLAIAADYDSLELQGFSSGDSLEVLRAKSDRYDSGMLEVLGDLLANSVSVGRMKKLTPIDLVPGQVFAQDVLLRNGTLLAVSGSEVTPSVISFLQNTENKHIPETLMIRTHE
jgi:hypothetical protein